MDWELHWSDSSGGVFDLFQRRAKEFTRVRLIIPSELHGLFMSIHSLCQRLNWAQLRLFSINHAADSLLEFDPPEHCPNLTDLTFCIMTPTQLEKARRALESYTGSVRKLCIICDGVLGPELEHLSSLIAPNKSSLVRVEVRHPTLAMHGYEGFFHNSFRSKSWRTLENKFGLPIKSLVYNGFSPWQLAARLSLRDLTVATLEPYYEQFADDNSLQPKDLSVFVTRRDATGDSSFSYTGTFEDPALWPWFASKLQILSQVYPVAREVDYAISAFLLAAAASDPATLKSMWQAVAPITGAGALLDAATLSPWHPGRSGASIRLMLADSAWCSRVAGDLPEFLPRLLNHFPWCTSTTVKILTDAHFDPDVAIQRFQFNPAPWLVKALNSQTIERSDLSEISQILERYHKYGWTLQSCQEIKTRNLVIVSGGICAKYFPSVFPSYSDILQHPGFIMECAAAFNTALPKLVKLLQFYVGVSESSASKLPDEAEAALAAAFWAAEPSCHNKIGPQQLQIFLSGLQEAFPTRIPAHFRTD